MAEPEKSVTPMRQGIISMALKDKGALYVSYMSFVKNGGLFIPTNKTYKLGDEVFILLTLLNDTEKMPVAGRVVWITPKGAHGHRVAGIGVQFSNLDQGTARNKIEGLLAGLLTAERDTHTL